MANVPLGIDLGTTFSCIAAFDNKRPEVLVNEVGNRVTPSIVSFTDEERLIGDAVYAVELNNSTNTVYGSKRMLGRKYDDPEVQNDMKTWPFTVARGVDGMPEIEVQFKKETKRFTPEEISSFILQKMKQCAKKYGDDAVNAVITVPAYFSDAQRTATINAGKIAGLNVLGIINEPTAAALAFGFNTMAEDETKEVLIFDLGGGTFDVTILEIEGSNFTVKATAGDTHLGGEDFDISLVNLIADKFKRANSIDLRLKPRSLKLLKGACEKAKRTLSTALKVKIDIPNIEGDISLMEEVTREEFERINEHLFQKCIEPMKTALSIAKFNKDDITDVILVGGSSHIPRVQKLLHDFIGKTPISGVDANEAVACGAAIKAAILMKPVSFRVSSHNPYEEFMEIGGDSDSDVDILPSPARVSAPELFHSSKVVMLSSDDEGSDAINEIVLVDVTPLSIGVGTAGGLTETIIPRGTVLPAKAEKTFATFKDNQKKATIRLYEGERVMSKENKLLGCFDIIGLPRALAHEVKFTIFLSLHDDGILECTAQVLDQKKDPVVVQFDSKKNQLSDFMLEKMTEEAKEMEKEDEKRRELINSINSFLAYCYTLLKLSKKKPEDIQSQVKVIVDENLEFIHGNFPKGCILQINNSIRDINRKRDELEKRIKPLLFDDLRKH